MCRVIRRIELSAIPLPDSWLPESPGPAQPTSACYALHHPRKPALVGAVIFRQRGVIALACVCGPAGTAPQALAGHNASPPAPVLGYSNTLYLLRVHSTLRLASHLRKLREVRKPSPDCNNRAMPDPRRRGHVCGRNSSCGVPFPSINAGHPQANQSMSSN